MALPPDIKVTSEILWQAAGVFLLVDAGFGFLLVRRISSDAFRQLKWNLVITTAVFWLLMWSSMSLLFWDPVYRYVFPEWSRWIIPPVYGGLFGCIAIFFWWVALRLPGNVVMSFLLLGGAWGSITHAWAITRGLLEKPPMLQGISSLSAVVMPFFEFMFYWSVILCIASVIHSIHHRLFE